ncbi:GNAT family N-acetyltransferase [Dyadobacter sandarakinus]|uniref:GNAT family N-acetyltransferase n=1 Tax=Dyadobacter sandarakinus TaxID=2747268 RepID=A0ABX7I586_9BACT|nr:GNAT family N-acetyltransferase [Dyadobacter sandarakinus]QRR01261.1 GNAT family N-acetyltransferase [Dyadobacter sandarakinus]
MSLSSTPFEIVQASTDADYATAACLFAEYADSLDFTLSFQNFDNELTILPQMYGPPRGALLIVQVSGQSAGVAGLRQIENDETCEIKRMYIRPEFRGLKLGNALMTALIDIARKLGYKTVKLDTLGPKMPAAVNLYRSFSFQEIPAYNVNPHEGILYFAKTL